MSVEHPMCLVTGSSLWFTCCAFSVAVRLGMRWVGCVVPSPEARPQCVLLLTNPTLLLVTHGHLVTWSPWSPTSNWGAAAAGAWAPPASVTARENKLGRNQTGVRGSECGSCILQSVVKC